MVRFEADLFSWFIIVFVFVVHKWCKSQSRLGGREDEAHTWREPILTSGLIVCIAQKNIFVVVYCCLVRPSRTQS